MEREIIEFETMLKGFTNNEQTVLKELQTKDQEEIYILILACRNIIYEQCYKTILEKNLINNIKARLLKKIDKKIQEIRSSQLPVAFSSKLELYIEKEEQEIEILEKLYEQIEISDNETIVKNIITMLVASPELIKQQKNQKDNMTKEKLKELSYDKQPCINEDTIDNKVIGRICKYIIKEGLKDIVLKVQITLENNEKFCNLRTIKENAEILVTEYYISILQEKLNNIKEYLDNNEIIRKLKKKNKMELSLAEIRTKLEKNLNKNSIFTSEQKKSEIKSLIEKIDLIYLIKSQIETNEEYNKGKNELTEQQRKMFESTEIYKEMQNRRNEDKIELSKERFIKRIREEMNQIAGEISNSLTEEVIANEQEQEKIKEFAKHLSISVQKLTKILADDENIYLYLITNWLTYEIEKSVNTQEQSTETIIRMSPETPPSKIELAELIMKTIEIPPYLRSEIKSEINTQILTNKKIVKKIGTSNSKGKKQKRKIRRNS